MVRIFFNHLNKLITAVLPLAFLCLPFRADSQIKEFYIADPASIVVHPNASLNIFSDYLSGGDRFPEDALFWKAKELLGKMPMPKRNAVIMALCREFGISQ